MIKPKAICLKISTKRKVKRKNNIYDQDFPSYKQVVYSFTQKGKKYEDDILTKTGLFSFPDPVDVSRSLVLYEKYKIRPFVL